MEGKGAGTGSAGCGNAFGRRIQETDLSLKAQVETEDTEVGWADESAAKPEVHVRRTFDPEGKTLVVRQPGQWFHSSVIGSVNERKRKIALIVDHLRDQHPKRVKNGFRRTNTGLSFMIFPASARN